MIAVNGSIYNKSDKDCFKIIPPKTGSYVIYTEGNTDTKGILYEKYDNSADDIKEDSDNISDYKIVSKNSDSPAKKTDDTNNPYEANANFRIGKTLEGGKEYYLMLSGENDSTGEYSLYYRKLEEPNDTHFSEQWALLNTGQDQGKVGVDINVLPVWEYTKGSGVTVAVLDTGTEITHSDLNNNLLSGYNVIHTGHENDVFPADEYSGDESSKEGHGTHVAGIIGALQNNKIGISGVAPEAKILPIKVL